MAKIIFFCFLFSTCFAGTQTFHVLTEEVDSINFNHQLDSKSFIYTSINSKKHIDFSRMYEITTLEKNAPQIPKMSTSILLGSIGTPEIEVTFDSFTEIQNVEIAPSKGNLKRNIDPINVPYEFGEVYQTNAFYPGKLADLSKPFISRDMRGVTVTVFPYQYNPITKILRVYENLKVRITNNQSHEGVNEIVNSSTSIQTKNMNRSLFINQGFIEKYAAVEEVGDLLIICPAEMDSVVQIFANWKIQKGIKTKIVHTMETGIGVTNIKNYIDNYYALNGDFLYLLLIGDHEDIPAHTYGELAGEQLWSDSYYGQLAGNDFYPELFVGRFSGNQKEIENMIQRSIEYEKNTASGNWMQKAIGLASAEGSGLGLNGMADWVHMRDLRTDLLFSTYTEVNEFYDGSKGGNDAIGDPTNLMMKETINNGVGLINYAGHGDLNIFNTSVFSSIDILNLENQGKYPWVISVACNHGAFANETCISEQWLRVSQNGSSTGAIAACGSSILMSWAPPMKTQKEIVGFITNADPSNEKKTIGGIFYNAQMKMLEQYQAEEGEEVMQTWILFGDPTTEFRSKQALEMQVSHPIQISQSESSLIVSCDVEGALISVSQNNIFLGKGDIMGGSTTISLPLLPTDFPLTITATKQNYKPYQGLVQVGNGPLGTNLLKESKISIFPNPADSEVNVVFTSTSIGHIQIVNGLGQILRTIPIEAGEIKEVISISDLSSGIYQLLITNSENSWTEKLIIR